MNEEELTLIVNRYSACRAIIDTGKLTSQYDIDRMMLLVRLDSDLLVDKIDEEIIIYPATWWDAVKDRFIPQFLRKYIKIEMIRKEWTYSAGFPNAQLYDALKDRLGEPVIISKISTEKLLDEDSD